MKIERARMIAVVLICMLLALPAPALATPPEPLTIEANLWLTGEDSTVGYFWTNGLFEDGGTASEVFRIAADTIHGVKTLVSNDGTITIRFQAQLAGTGPTAVTEGRFVIVSGTGRYEKLHAVGETYATLDLSCFGPECPPTIWARYTGQAHLN